MKAFILDPVYRDYIWGGEKLKRAYNKRTSLETVAESWELSVYDESESMVASGELKGMDLRAFSEKYPMLVGTKSGVNILIKLIDAREALSVQVHPGDGYAARVECGNGKTELWHVLECERDSSLYYGFSRDTTREEVEARIGDNTITEILRKVYVKPGDSFFIPAGTIHAIGAGIVVAEIQQSSDLTYRVYDFARPGKDGKPRELHIKKALDVLDYKAAILNMEGAPPKTGQGYTVRNLADCEYFKADRLSLNGGFTGETHGVYAHLLCLDGEAVLDCGGSLELVKGQSAFIPADNECYSLVGAGEFVITSQK